MVPGELTIVTGVPNSGKSEWIDALLCKLNESAGWKFALCSMENRVSLIHGKIWLHTHLLSVLLWSWFMVYQSVGTVPSWGFTQWLVETELIRKKMFETSYRSSCWISHIKYLTEFKSALSFHIQEEREV